MRVKFNRTVRYEQNDPAACKTYLEGETYDLEREHAHRWIRRGVAEEVADEPSSAVVAEPASEATEDESPKPKGRTNKDK